MSINGPTEGPAQSNNELFEGNNWVLPSTEGVEAEASGVFEDRIKAVGGWNEEEVFFLKLCFDEALTNAMKHGNKFDPNKKAFVNFSITKERVYIKIKDEGEGFTVEKVPSPLEGEGLTKGSGRGVFLMKQFLGEDGLKYSEGGRVVEMTKEKK